MKKMFHFIAFKFVIDNRHIFSPTDSPLQDGTRESSPVLLSIAITNLFVIKEQLQYI